MTAFGAEPARAVQLGAILAVGLAIRVAFIPSIGYRDDMLIFSQWFREIAHLAPGAVYAHIADLNYPPLYVALIEGSAALLRLFVPGPPSDAVLNVVLKAPAIACDIVGAGLAYAIVRRSAGHLSGLGAAVFLALNPAFIYDSAFWGQVDAIPTVLALASIYVLTRGNLVGAWLLLAAAALVKPHVVVLAPLLALAPLTEGYLRRGVAWAWTAVGGGLAALLTVGTALCYFPRSTPWGSVHAFLAMLANGSSYFAFNTLNAFNLWALFGPFFASDRVRIFHVSQHVWAAGLFCAVAAVIFWRYATARRAAGAGAFEASVLVMLAFFLLLTEMHERYLYYAVVFCGALLYRRSYRIAALSLSLTLILNLEYSLTFMYLDDAKATAIDRFAFAPVLAHLCALANLAIFGGLLAEFLGVRVDLARAWSRLGLPAPQRSAPAGVAFERFAAKRGAADAEG